jgi:AraC-like DNA-binding protein
VIDAICSSDSSDHAFEERHEGFSMALVVAGAFDYHGAHGRAHLQTGAVLLGNAGAAYCCSHTHSAGDRCIAFQFAPEAFESLWATHGKKGRSPAFGCSFLPAGRTSVGLIAAAEALAEGSPHIQAEELAMMMASFVLSHPEGRVAPLSGRRLQRIVEVARAIEVEPDADWTLRRLAQMAGMDIFGFIRCFKRANGLTPHAFVRQLRLREAARLLRTSDTTVIRAAVDAGFGDLSTFNAAFKSTFGATPTAYRSGFRSIGRA